MTVVSLSIFAGVGWQGFTNNGVPLAGGQLFTYEAGTTTSLATYTSSLGNTYHTNPIILDAGGKVPNGGEIWLDYSHKYKFVVKTSTGVVLNTYDNIGGSFNTSPLIDTWSGNGVRVDFELTSSPASKDTTNVFINGVYQNKSTYSVSPTIITFSEAPPFNSTIQALYV